MSQGKLNYLGVGVFYAPRVLAVFGAPAKKLKAVLLLLELNWAVFHVASCVYGEEDISVAFVTQRNRTG